MSSSTSDDISDASNMSSQSYRDSRYSPLQQVAREFTELTCMDKNLNNGVLPYLQIIEQPQDHFRFRYVSEMVGTHGCLLGKSCMTVSTKPKTHPTVELVNYFGRALIRCQLAQNNNPNEHPHRLLEEENDKDLCYEVPEHGSYRVAFPGMGIIHTAKKDVPDLLIRRFHEQHPNTHLTAQEIKAHCESIAKRIDLNIVRLKFSAHDIKTGKEICEPVFSEPIHNMKSASTNDLKICRISKCSGRPSGGDDVFILVEKVNKKNIKIRFYELNENGERVWTAEGSFRQSDVHHQYAIVFGTPAYHNPKITTDVKVYIELFRPTDGRCSEPKEFIYKADLAYKSNKKRKVTSSYSSVTSSSGGSIRSLSDLPATVFMNNAENAPESLQLPMQQFTMSGSTSPRELELGSALMDTDHTSVKTSPQSSPMWGQTVLSAAASELPPLALDSTELQNIINAPNQDTKHQLETVDLLKDYFTSFSSIDPLDEIPTITSSMEILRSLQLVVSDSGRGKATVAMRKLSSAKVGESSPPAEKPKEMGEYTAMYTKEDGEEVKKLVKELCDAVRQKPGYKKVEVRRKLERLFELRLSNGDTFLHMTLCSNLPSFDFIVKLIHSVKMTHLFDYYNDKMQTILLLAILNDMPKIVSLLVAKGCDPMLKDVEDENAIHYAVRCRNCLEPLLDAIKKNDVPCDLNDSNNERQSPLHLAAKYGWSLGVRLLLSHGASYNVRDLQGRTPLHIAAVDLNAQLIEALVQSILPCDIDATDESGNTALQIVCSRPMTENSLKIVKMLLDKKADPLRHEEYNAPAMHLVRDKPDLMALMKEYVPEHSFDDDVKSEPEDEYESADEYEDVESVVCGLSDIREWQRDVCPLLDASGAWRPLATRMHLDSLLKYFEAQPSPTLMLLNHLKECREEITSKSLVIILEEMGEKDAANIIRKHIE